MTPDWQQWIARLRALAEAGSASDPHHFDAERYAAVRDISAEMAAQLAAAVPAENAVSALDTGVQVTPKVDVRGFVLHQSRVLLVRELLDGGRWTLPGGWADVNQTPAEAAAREVLEEAGYRVRPVRLLLAADKRAARHEHPPHERTPILKLFFLCDLLDTTPVQHTDTSAKYTETSEAAFFTLEQLTALELSAGRVTLAQLTRCFALAQQPAAPADFDLPDGSA